MNRDALFSAEWAAALERELGADPDYRRTAASWHGSLLFLLLADPAHGVPEERALFLDLDHGSTRAVRPALPDDPGRARFHLVAPAPVWIELLEGAIEPAAALMGGRLRLARGSLFSLLPHLEAARRLLACAQRVGAGEPARAGDP